MRRLHYETLTLCLHKSLQGCCLLGSDFLVIQVDLLQPCINGCYQTRFPSETTNPAHFPAEWKDKSPGELGRLLFS